VLSLSPPIRIFLCVLPTDMRRGFDGLMRMAEEHLQQNVLDGGLFVFVNRRRDRVKLLYWDGDGLCLWQKRLEAGTVELPTAPSKVTHVTLTATELALLLGGIELASAKRRKRYRRATRSAPPISASL
jgi:transposase